MENSKVELVGQKRLIIHFIDSLSLGGAEVLLKNTVNLLPEFNHLVLYLNKPDVLKSHFNNNVEFICLNHEGWMNFFTTLIAIKKILKKRKPLLIHSHLFYSTLFARLGLPRGIPLISTLHSVYSIDAFQKNKKSEWVERLTLKNVHALIGVSQYVLEDYLKWIPFKGKKYVLYNFLPNRFFNKRMPNSHNEVVRCIAVGNLKEAKNYPYLLDIFLHLKEESIFLDIYGAGGLEKELQLIINREKLNVRLCGGANNISEVIQNYDLFFQASTHEGFGLSVIEAMAVGVPLFVSDIPVFREITHELAHFFPLDDASKAAASIKKVIKDKNRLQIVSDLAFIFAQEQYSERVYKSKLFSIYEEVSNIKLIGSTCVE